MTADVSTAPSGRCVPARGSGLGRRIALAALPVLLVVLGGAPWAAADGDEPVAKREYQAFVAAWMKRDPVAVVKLVAPRAQLRLSLLSPRVSGSYQHAQAIRTLKDYFEQVAGIALKDVTKPLQAMPRGYFVRQYDYTHARRGHDSVTTRLTVTMRLHGGNAWMLDAIAESVRPRR